MTESPEEILLRHGYDLPASAPLGLYLPAVQVGSLIMTSGAVPVRDGQVLVAGKVGTEVSVERAQEAARLATVNALAAARGLCGALAEVVRVVRLVGFVNSAPGFTGQPGVMNAASQLLIDVFGERGRCARSAVGAAELPLDVAVEVELTLEVRTARDPVSA